jgi:hypothetical protein
LLVITFSVSLSRWNGVFEHWGKWREVDGYHHATLAFVHSYVQPHPASISSALHESMELAPLPLCSVKCMYHIYTFYMFLIPESFTVHFINLLQEHPNIKNIILFMVWKF